ncbi:MAG: SPASM domain-containing protein [Lachnospiraceae bacterium]|nr:SPASM domain-containing protein [Lachnospiraceae bacterium]
MNTSQYNFYKDLFNERRYGVIYNSYSGAIIRINDYVLWNNIIDNKTELMDDSEISVLIENGIIVSSHDEEYRTIKERYEVSVESSNTLYLTIMPTESCNFACPYCFEYEKKHSFMDKATYNRIYKLVEDFTSKNPTLDKVYLNWFGGEPTLCIDEVVDFSRRFKKMCESKNLKMQGAITTNGYLLDKETFIRLIDSGIQRIQITIDGEKDTHNRTRYLQNGQQGTFDVIWNNLMQISGLPQSVKFDLDIRCNFLKNTIESTYHLIDRVMSFFKEDDRIHIYCRPVYLYKTKGNSIEKVENDILSIEEGIEQQNCFYEYINKYKSEASRRLFDLLPQPTNCWCNADKKLHLIIGSKGELYVCDTLTGDEYVLDNINNLKDIDKVRTCRYNIFDDVRTSDCLKCKLLPVCMGGCMRNRLDGKPSCYWTEEIIEKSLNKYIDYMEVQDEKRA